MTHTGPENRDFLCALAETMLAASRIDHDGYIRLREIAKTIPDNPAGAIQYPILMPEACKHQWSPTWGFGIPTMTCTLCGKVEND